MKLSDLQKKDIININDGKVIGRIIDAEFDITSGHISSFLIEKNQMFKTIFSNSEDVYIEFSKIKKLGEDVILIDIA